MLVERRYQLSDILFGRVHETKCRNGQPKGTLQWRSIIGFSTHPVVTVTLAMESSVSHVGIMSSTQVSVPRDALNLVTEQDIFRL